MESLPTPHQPYTFEQQPFDPDKFPNFKTHEFRRERMGKSFTPDGHEVTVVDIHKFTLEESLWYLHKDRLYDDIDNQIADLVLDAKDFIREGAVTFVEGDSSSIENDYARHRLKYLLQQKHAELFDSIFDSIIDRDIHPFRIRMNTYLEAVNPVDGTVPQEEALTQMYYKRFGCDNMNWENNAIMGVVELIASGRVGALLSFEEFKVEDERARSFVRRGRRILRSWQ